MKIRNKKTQLKEYEKELQEIYENTTKAFRQRAGMRRRIAYICDKIVELENDIYKDEKTI